MVIGSTRTKEVQTTAMISATSIVHGVPPRSWPTLRSWMISPPSDVAQQATAATASTAITPPGPVTPIVTRSRAATIRLESARPEIGLAEEPMTPTRYPATAEKTNPVIVIAIAATNAPARLFTYQ